MQLSRSLQVSKVVTISGGILLALLLIANIWSPLRLNVDAIRYFGIMFCLKGMLLATDSAATDFLPHGYPWLLKLLADLGILRSATVVIINIFSAVASGLLLAKLFGEKHKWLFVALITLSYINIKHLTLPTADEIFSCFLVLSIYCWTEAIVKKRMLFYPLAILITIVAIYMRTAGIVIPAGIIAYLIFANRGILFKNRYFMIAAVVMIAAAITLFAINLTTIEHKVDYIRQLELRGLLTNGAALFSRLSIHFQEAGEFLINVPYSKLNSVVPSALHFLTMPMLILIGALTIVFVVYVALKGKLYQQLAFWVYSCYLMMILLWPFYDSRFLVPIIPFFIYCFYIAYQKRFGTTLLKGILTIYILAGTAALLYSTMISVNKDLFVRFYGFDKTLSEQYRKHFDDVKKGRKVNYDIHKDRISYILNKYDR